MKSFVKVQFEMVHGHGKLLSAQKSERITIIPIWQHTCFPFYYTIYRNFLRLNKKKIKSENFLEMDIYFCPFFQSTNEVLPKK